MKIATGCHVKIDYALENTDGDLLETSDEDEPIELVVGAGDLPHSIERALEGHSEGDSIEVQLGPDELFGPYDPEAIVSVGRAEFPQDVELEVGTVVSVTLQGEDPDEEAPGEFEATVTEVTADAIVLDANPPLAGQPLVFRATVRGVAASEG